MQRCRFQSAAALVAALACSSAEAFAAPPAPGAASEADRSREENEARGLFGAALSDFKAQQYSEALDRFNASIEKKKTRSAMGYVASCLRQLGRYDEALDQYERMRLDYPSLPEAVEKTVAAEMAELAGLVGTLVVTGDVPADATFFLDDRARGALPLEAPLRVSAGSRKVRVEKKGFEPIEATVEVKAGKENEARLTAKSRRGRLVVTERRGWALTVEIDGRAVGTTPWEGLLEIGPHSVRLRGSVGVEDLASCGTSGSSAAQEQVAMGTSASSEVTVKLYERTSVALSATGLDGALHIDATPEEASVAIDGKVVGKGTFRGRLPLGDYKVLVTAPGFVPATRTVRVEPRQLRDVSVALEIDPARVRGDAARSLSRIAAWAGYGVGVLGLGVSAVTGGLAAAKISDIRSRCGGDRCPLVEQSNLDTGRALATASTSGLVVGTLGVAVGTAAVIVSGSLGEDAPRSDAGRAPPLSGIVLGVGPGLGSLEIGGRF